MTVAWTAHRFSGGVLALDTTNTVLLRNDPGRRFDRFDDPAEIARFAGAAAVFRRDEIGRPLTVADPHSTATVVRGLREAADALFRAPAAGRPFEASALSEFLRHCAVALDGREGLNATPDAPFGTGDEPLAFEAALAVSALTLLGSGNLRRLKICPNCSWLFLDKSRNSSRLWCDMTVCGNRAKARHHYRRQRMQRSQREETHV
jgi:predicted RNA-binding Zn ribbon-like protein